MVEENIVGASTDTDPNGLPVKVLIVDDDKKLQQIYLRFLVKKGFTVELADSGSQALEKLGTFEPEIILLDVHLPDMNGFDILSSIRSDSRYAQIYVIMVTGYDISDVYRARGLESGADDYLPKPVTLEVLLARINALVRIKSTGNKLHHINQTLEKTVEKRTAELKKSNDSLRKEIKRHEQTLMALKYSEERLQGLFRQAPICGAVIGLDYKIQHVNMEICRMTGYEEKDLIGVSVENIIHPKDDQGDLVRYKKLLSGEIDHFVSERRYRLPNHKKLWCRMSVRLLENPDGSQYFLHLMTDIGREKKAQQALEKAHDTLELRVAERTFQLEAANRVLKAEIGERKKAQEESRRQERHLEATQRIASIGSFLTRSNTLKMDCSCGFYRLFGYEPGRVEPGLQFIKDHIYSKDLKRFETDIKSVYESGASLDNEYRILSRTGTIREIRFIATAATKSSHDGEIQGILQDITDKKIMERKAIQNEKLASLGFLASGMAHEINNPNNFISFNIPILREYLENILPIVDTHAREHPSFEICNMIFPDFRKDLLKLIDNIENGSLRINKIVSSLRKFVHMKSDTKYRKVDMKKVIQGCVEIARGKVEKLVQTFDVSFSDNLPLINADPEIIEIAVINLLINAAQACDKPDSFVRIEVFYEVCLIRQIVITVTDNGCGMDEQTISRAFDPFFSTKSSQEGTGIGLALCHNLVSALGGSIQVQSRIGEGSNFTLMIPDTEHKIRCK